MAFLCKIFLHKFVWSFCWLNLSRYIWIRPVTFTTHTNSVSSTHLLSHQYGCCWRLQRVSDPAAIPRALFLIPLNNWTFTLWVLNLQQSNQLSTCKTSFLSSLYFLGKNAVGDKAESLTVLIVLTSCTQLESFHHRKKAG